MLTDIKSTLSIFYTLCPKNSQLIKIIKVKSICVVADILKR